MNLTGEPPRKWSKPETSIRCFTRDRFFDRIGDLIESSWCRHPCCPPFENREGWGTLGGNGANWNQLRG